MGATARVGHPREIGFRTIEDPACFVIVTDSGRLIAIELSSGHELALPPQTQAVLDEETKLKQRFDRQSWSSAKCEGVVALDCIVRAVEFRILGVLRWLRELEKDESGIAIAGDDGLTAVVYPLRQFARASLRRLKEQTEFGFRPVTIESLSAAAAARGAPARMQGIGADLVTPGMTMESVLQIAGSPEHVSAISWSYDIDGPRALTVSVNWDAATATVASVDYLPPYWETHRPDGDLLRQCALVLPHDGD
jgi:hypothetical protein